MKTIVIEALSALRGGGQTYLRNLFDNYPEDLNSVRVIAIVPEQHRNAFAADERIQLICSRFASRSLFTRMLWLRWRLPRLLGRLKADVLYCPGGTLTCKPGPECKTAVAFRNMLPFSPDQVRKYGLSLMRARLWLLRRVQLASLRRADLVVFVSSHAKSVIDGTAAARHGASVVIPHGVADRFRARTPAPAAPLASEYVLYVSILNVYKAQLEVIEAWCQLRQQRPTPEKLLMVGPQYKPYGYKVRALISERHLDDEVILLGSIPYQQLPAYYQNAKVNLFASECENCPNILLEALASGRPVACSNAAPMPEFAAEAAVYFDSREPQQIARALRSVLDDAAYAREMGRRALERSDVFQWRKTARQTWGALHSLARSQQERP